MGHYREEAEAKLEEAVENCVNGNAIIYVERACREAIELLRLADLEELEDDGAA
jgi:hypothetical protein